MLTNPPLCCNERKKFFMALTFFRAFPATGVVASVNAHEGGNLTRLSLSFFPNTSCHENKKHLVT